MSSNQSHPGKYDNVRLHIEYLDLASIGVSRRTTNKHNARQIKKLAGAIDRSGFNVPVLVDDEPSIVSGHTRLAAAKLLGLSSVPVIRISHLTPEQLRLFAIFDNKIAGEATIDLEAVHLELSEIVLEAPELDLTDSGFEIDAMNGLHRTQELDDLDEDLVPPNLSVSRLGDLWRLGRHRVICGDATDTAVIDELVGGRPVRALVSDPPYNLAIPGIVSGKGRVKHGNFAMASGEMSQSEFVDFLSQFIAAAKPHLMDGAMALIFMDWRHIAEFLSAGGQEGLHYRQPLVWAKSNPAMGALWRNAHELVAVFKHGDAPNIDNVQLGKFGRNRSNVMHYPGANVPTKGRRRALEMHATVKPIALIADLILDVTSPGVSTGVQKGPPIGVEQGPP
ncbi:site-specific DNA-methyltransferase, partial [uncultured Sphingomonas sp.]|uniref:site-specific DNA-methyltransferase n=1 Tax=uncultured Sphingomonas sp. TaxID=158754 RepID=UPI0035CA619E